MITIKKKDFNDLYQLACSDWKSKFRKKFEDSFFTDELEFDENFLYEMQAACNDKQIVVFNKIFKEFVKDTVDLFKITTYSAVCKALKESELTEKDFKHLPEYMRTKSLNQAKINQLERLFNGNWKADWKNYNQSKWYCYLTDYGSGLVAIGVYCCASGFDGYPGYFKDQKTAQHILDNFVDIYKGLA